MEQILSQLEARANWKETMRKNCRQNKLNVDLAAYYTPLRFKAAHANFLQTHTRKSRNNYDRWLQNELKAFYWICVALSSTRDRKISAFGDHDWQLLQEVFPFKKLVTLQYEALRMTVESGRQVDWTQEEDGHLCEILRQQKDGANKWNEFARQLYERSDRKYLRSGKQCRERWLNHLDPSKRHGSWSLEQDRMLVEVLMKVGKRWSKVAKSLGGLRTEHMVKNRYKTIVAREKRSHPEINDEDRLFRTYLQGDGCSKDETTPVQTKMRDESAEDKEQKETQSAKTTDDNNYKIVIMEEVGEEEYKDLIVSQEQEKDSPMMLATPRLPDLPRVYSPWFLGLPITPTVSPNVPFLIKVQNFSSYENSFMNSYYRGQAELKNEL